MVSLTMGNVLSGMVFLKKYSVTLDNSKHPINFPDMSLQLKNANGKYKRKMCKLPASQILVVSPLQQIMIPICTNEEKSTSQRTLEATPSVTGKAALLVTPAIVKLENNRTVNQITNPSDHTYTTNLGANLANLIVLLPN